MTRRKAQRIDGMNSTTKILIRKNSDDDYTVRVYGGHKWTFSDIIAELKDIIPSHARSWQPDDKEWRIRSDYFLHKWLDEVRLLDCVEIEWGREGKRQQYQAPPRPSRRAEAFKALHLLETAPPELVKAAHKTLAFLHHPDRGGDLRIMQGINAAYDALVKEAA
jgi:hypothetical protein